MKIITSFDDLTGVNVRFWAKLLDMPVEMQWYTVLSHNQTSQLLFAVSFCAAVPFEGDYYLAICRKACRT